MSHDVEMSPVIQTFTGKNLVLELITQAIARVINFSKSGAQEMTYNFRSYCSDFRYESNGTFVLGVGFFFLQTNFDFLTSHF